MKRSLWLFALPVAVLTLACAPERTEEALPEEPGAASEPAAPQASAEAAPSVMQGAIASVNSEQQTFTIDADDGTQRRFTYTDATEVVGAPGVQGLTGRDGDRVVVHYREDLDANVALKIELQ